jgi:hypothetical protein
MSSPNDLIGERVEWELSGRGRGTIQQGLCVMIIEPGTTNRDALKQLRKQMPDLLVREKYKRFDPDTHTTRRAFVLVEQPSKRRRVIKWIYAPNVKEIVVV